MKTIKLNLSESYIPFYCEETFYKFDAKLADDMKDAEYEKLDENLAVASDDYIRLSFSKTEGVHVVATVASPAQILAAVDVLDTFGFRADFDEDILEDSDLPYCYWEE